MIPTLNILEAVEALKRGGVIAYPTETFYGLGCDATSADAVRRLFEIKGRALDVAIPALLDDPKKLSQYVEEIPEVAKTLMRKYWPGPLTLIFRAKGLFPKELLAGTGKIALRFSGHAAARELAQALGLPLTTTSANPSGLNPARSAEEVRAFGLKLDGIFDGGLLPPAKGSTILDVSIEPARLVREGEISKQELSTFLKILS
ncbi:MAG: L-threonylcarbamoyladenylate synthase [bacterium]